MRWLHWRGPPDRWCDMTDDRQHIPAQKARSGEISGRVRNVLFISVGLAVLALAVVTSYFVA
jgi:hypothetical protein